MNTEKILFLAPSIKLASGNVPDKKQTPVGMDAVSYHKRPYFYQVQTLPDAWRRYAGTLPKSQMFSQNNLPAWMRPGSPYYVLGSGLMTLQNYLRAKPTPARQGGMGALVPKLIGMAPSAMEVMNNISKPFKSKGVDYDYLASVFDAAEDISD